MPAEPNVVVFHHPLPLSGTPSAGSQVRPRRMVEAFEALGYEVLAVDGYAAQRRTLGREATALAGEGRVAFAYAEASSAPTALNEPHHLPNHPLVDPILFARLRRAGVRIGLFYRDVYWRFDVYRRAVPPWKRWPAVALYHADLRWYRALVDHLFLPSMRMLAAVPGGWPAGRVSALPPGGDPRAVAIPPAAGAGGLSLLYVGGVTPPLYDLSPLLDAAAAVGGVRLTVCCPPGEAASFRAYANAGAADVVHLRGEAVGALYDGIDAACLVFGPNEYRSFAAPVKLFEAVGRGVPVLASSGTFVGDTVAAEQLGWVVDGKHDLERLLRALVADRPTRDQARRRVLDARSRHTWTERAREVARVLAPAGV